MFAYEEEQESEVDSEQESSDENQWLTAVHASDVKNAPIDIEDLHEPEKVITIRRINIFDSPILSAWKGEQQVHLVLDTGATASLISQEKATELTRLLQSSISAHYTSQLADL